MHITQQWASSCMGYGVGTAKRWNVPTLVNNINGNWSLNWLTMMKTSVGRAAYTALLQAKTYTCGSVINWRVLKWVFIASSCHLFSFSNCSISGSSSRHVTQVTAVCSRRSHEIISFHLIRPGHESTTDAENAWIYINVYVYTQDNTECQKLSADYNNRNTLLLLKINTLK